MKSFSLVAVLCAAVAVQANPLGEPSTIPGLVGRELGMRAAPGCSVGACGGQIPSNVVCCAGWICVNASAGGSCLRWNVKKDAIEGRAVDVKRI